MTKTDEKWPCVIHGTTPPAASAGAPPHSRLREKDVDPDGFIDTSSLPLSTFPATNEDDSYSLSRALINAGSLPLAAQVSPEEFLNHFLHRAPLPRVGQPFGYSANVFACPWNASHQLLQVTVRASECTGPTPPASAIVFALQPMPSDQLALAKDSLREVVNRSLSPNDHLGIVLGATSKLSMTRCRAEELETILTTIDALDPPTVNLNVSLSTAISLVNSAPDLALKRIIVLANDLPTLQDAPRTWLQQAVADGTFTSVIGIQPSEARIEKLQAYATAGNGSFAIASTTPDITRALARESHTEGKIVATQVTANIELNPALVSQYRRIAGPATSLSPATKANEILPLTNLRQGDTFTALYEIIPIPAPNSLVDTAAIVDIEYWPLDCAHPRTLSFTVPNTSESPASEDTPFAAAVAEFAMLLSDSPYKGTATYTSALQLAIEALGEDPYGHRAEFVELVQRASILAK